MISIRPITKQDIERIKPMALAISSLIFNTVSMFTTIKATVESTRIIDKHREDGTLDTKVIINEVAPKYILPAASFVAGQASGIGSAVLSRQQNLALSGAMTATAYRYKQYREKTKELYGDNADDRILIELSKDATAKYVDYSNCVGNSIDNVHGEYTFNDNPTYFAPQGKILFFDELRYGQPRSDGSHDDGFFVCTVNQFQQARLHLNRNFVLRGDAYLNEFYRFLGISETYIGDDLSWDMSEGYMFIDISIRPFTLDDGLIAYRVEYDFEPEDWHDMA